MAGAYPDPPDHRLAWDRDGSTAIRVDTDDTVQELTATDRATMNNESNDFVTLQDASGARLAILFPEPYDLDAYYLGVAGSDPVEIETSTDTTNGLDGTWVSQTTSPTYTTGSVSTAYREMITSLTVAGIVGIRARFNKAHSNDTPEVKAFHLYGAYSTPPPPALMLWDPDSDQRIDPAHLDWGDVARGTTATKRFRVKNLSGTDMAESVTLSTEALTDTTPTYVGQHDFSDDDGASFADPLDIGDLSPGEISGELLLRRDLANDAALSVWALRILAQATAWSEVS